MPVPPRSSRSVHARSIRTTCPIEAFQTDDERELASNLPAHMWAVGGSADGSDGKDGGGSNGHGLRPRPLRLRSIAGRLLGGDGPT